MNRALIFLFFFMLTAVLSLTVASVIWTEVHEGKAWCVSELCIFSSFLFFSFFLCLVSPSCTIILTVRARYLGFTNSSHWMSLLNIFTYFITFSMMIPISLYVTLEMVRVAQVLNPFPSLYTPF